MRCLCIQACSVFCWKVCQKSQKDILRIGLFRCRQRNSRGIPVNIDFSCFRILLDRWSNECFGKGIISRTARAVELDYDILTCEILKNLELVAKVVKHRNNDGNLWSCLGTRAWLNCFRPNLTWPKRRWRRRYEALLIIGVLEARYVAG